MDEFIFWRLLHVLKRNELKKKNDIQYSKMVCNILPPVVTFTQKKNRDLSVIIMFPPMRKRSEAKEHIYWPKKKNHLIPKCTFIGSLFKSYIEKTTTMDLFLKLLRIWFTQIIFTSFHFYLRLSKSVYMIKIAAVLAQRLWIVSVAANKKILKSNRLRFPKNKNIIWNK